MWVDNIICLGTLLFLSSNLVETGPLAVDLGKLVSERIQNINLYLIDAGLELDGQLGQLQATGANRVHRVSDKQMHQIKMIKQRLLEAGEELNSIGRDTSQVADLNKCYQPLLKDTDRKTLSEFLTNLSRPLFYCDNDNLDFLIKISSYRDKLEASDATTNDTQLLLVQNYAKLRVEFCWQRFLDSILRELNSQLSNLSLPVFKYIEQVAINMKRPPGENEVRMGGKPSLTNLFPISGRNAPYPIKIDENTKEALTKLFDPSWKTSSLDSWDSNKLKETIEALGEVLVPDGTEKMMYAIGIKRMYRDYLALEASNGNGDGRFDSKPKDTLKRETQEFYEKFIEQPCSELLERMSSILAGGKIFKGHVDQTLGDYLAKEKQNNMRLAYELQVYRICKKSKEASKEILHKLIYLTTQ